ncbi:glycosyltransferase [Proteus terrae]|uniref:glycosyltransferase family protein n=1 Tax=Proteus terrae TaxID=1574161 RepID=UPI00131F5AA1|nr:glycosyltransferase [Proteus terrae]QHD94175.1 glycosyltransferase [Proteus terrae subsp. cibarius]QJW49443.1 glycosyltransferase family 1 protein [Proteus terrae subsp. cibarius]
MKILIVGEYAFPIYEKSFYNAFKRLGYDVHKFSWIGYFKYYQHYQLEPQKKYNILKSIYYRFQNKYLIGPTINKINNDLIRKVNNEKYDLIFIYRGTHIYSSTLKKLKKNKDIKIFGYNNDDPFSKSYYSYVWRHYLKCLPYYDHIFAYREKNIFDYRNKGITSTSILMSYYIKENNFHYEHKERHDKNIKIVFIGHYENDGRDKILLSTAKYGFDLSLYGTGWEKSLLYNEIVSLLGKIKPIYNDEYNKILNNADVSFVFLSKLNNDTYTRRVFEIPVTKTVMLSERTSMIESLFKENEEIIFFENINDVIKKLIFLNENRAHLEEIKENAYNRVIKDGHEVEDRVKQIISTYENEK